MIHNRNSWERCAQVQQQLKALALSEPDHAQAIQDLALVRKQISSLQGLHGTDCYEKLGELLALARQLEKQIGIS